MSQDNMSSGRTVHQDETSASRKFVSPVGKVVSVKQVGEIRAGPEVKLLPGFSPDHFLEIGRPLEEQEQCRS